MALAITILDQGDMIKLDQSGMLCTLVGYGLNVCGGIRRSGYKYRKKYVNT